MKGKAEIALLLGAALAGALLLLTLLASGGGETLPPAAPADPTDGGAAPLESPLSAAAEAAGGEEAGAVAEAAGDEPPLPLRVRVVDGTTGREIDVPGVRFWAGGEPVSLRRAGGSWFLEDSGLSRGRGRGVVLSATPPAGYVEFPDRRPPPTPWIHREAAALEATIVLWPERSILVEVVDEEGRPVVGARIREVTLGEWGDLEIDARSAPSGPDGTIRVEGVPGVPGEWVTVAVAPPGGGEKFALSDDFRLEPGIAESRIRVVVGDFMASDEFQGPSVNSAIGIGGAPGGSAPEEVLPPARAEVRVLALDGTPLADVTVRVATATDRETAKTDEDGVALVVGLSPGAGTVSVREVGFHFGEPVGIALESGRTARATVREEPGRDFAVRVVTEDGTPVPGAEVDPGHWQGMPYVGLQGGVQRLDFVTGPDGWVRLPNYFPGTAEIRVTYGTRIVSAKAEPGGTLTITLP